MNEVVAKLQQVPVAAWFLTGVVLIDSTLTLVLPPHFFVTFEILFLNIPAGQ